MFMYMYTEYETVGLEKYDILSKLLTERFILRTP